VALLLTPPAGTSVYVEWYDHYQPSGPAWWTMDQLRDVGDCVNRSTGIFLFAENGQVCIVRDIAPEDEHTEALYGAPLFLRQADIVTLRSLTPCV
jgi:hypothetical protein